jgi:hypothetical protein
MVRGRFMPSTALFALLGTAYGGEPGEAQARPGPRTRTGPVAPQPGGEPGLRDLLSVVADADHADQTRAEEPHDLFFEVERFGTGDERGGPLHEGRPRDGCLQQVEERGDHPVRVEDDGLPPPCRAHS